MAEAAPAFDVGAFITGMLYLKISNYLTCIALVTWAWDIFITLDDEIALVWNRKGTLVKSLYLINRYFPIFTLCLNMMNTTFLPTVLGDIGCRAKEGVVIMSQGIELLVAPTIFVIRVYTISVSHPYIRRSLVFVTVTSYLAISALLFYGLARFMPTLFWSPAGFCLGVNQWAFGVMYCIPLLLDSFVFVATMYHAFNYNKTSKLLEATPTSMILHSLYFDGAIYYLLLLGIRIILVILFYSPKYFIFTISFLDFSLTSTLTSRWFLSFRKAVVVSQRGPNNSSHGSGRLDAGFWTNGSVTGQQSGQRTPYFPMAGVIMMRPTAYSKTHETTNGRDQITGNGTTTGTGTRTGTGTLGDSGISTKKVHYSNDHSEQGMTTEYVDDDVKDEYALPELPRTQNQKSRAHGLGISP